VEDEIGEWSFHFCLIWSTSIDCVVIAVGCDLQHRVAVSMIFSCFENMIINTINSLCTGTSRNPISVRSTHDHQALDWRMFPGASTEADARDFRLGISAQVLEATAKGLNKPFHNLQEFFTEIQELMTVFNHARNVCQPLRCESCLASISMQPPLTETHRDLPIGTPAHGRPVLPTMGRPSSGLVPRTGSNPCIHGCTHQRTTMDA
jgi:hypothetical protein